MIHAKFDRFIQLLNRICNFLLGIDMLAMFLVLMLQIISRFIAFLPIGWSQDMITFLLVCSVFLGVGSATGLGKQIRLEFFINFFPRKVNAILLCLADLVSIVFLCIIVKQAFRLALDNISVFMGSSLVAYGWYYAVVCFGAAVMVLNFVNLIWQRLYNCFAGNKEAAA